MLRINSGGGIVMISTPQARYSHAMSWVFYFQYFLPIFMCLSPSGKCQCWTAIISTFKRTNNDQWDWNTAKKRSFMLFLKGSLSFFSIRREDLHIQFGDIWGKWQNICNLCSRVICVKLFTFSGGIISIFFFLFIDCRGCQHLDPHLHQLHILLSLCRISLPLA